MFAAKPAMEIAALVPAWKEIDASQEASVVINGTYVRVLRSNDVCTSRLFVSVHSRR